MSDENNLFHQRFLHFLTSTNNSHRDQNLPLSLTQPRASLLFTPFWISGSSSTSDTRINNYTASSEGEDDGEFDERESEVEEDESSAVRGGYGASRRNHATTTETFALSADNFITLNAFEFVGRFAAANTSPGQYPWTFSQTTATNNDTTETRNRALTFRRRGSGVTRQNALRLRQVIRTQPRRDPTLPIWTMRPSPSPSSLNANRTSTKVSEEETGEGWTGYGCREYPLMFEVTENDAGEFSSAYKVQNILRKDESVFCSARRGNVVNIQLRFLGASTYSLPSEQLEQHQQVSEEIDSYSRTRTSAPFLLTKMIIKAPGRGFTAPCSEGLIFISHSPIVNSSTQQYDQWTWEDYQSYLDRSSTNISNRELHKEGPTIDADSIQPAGYFRLDPASNWTQEVRFGDARTGMESRKNTETSEDNNGISRHSNELRDFRQMCPIHSDTSISNNNTIDNNLRTKYARPHPYHRHSQTKSPHSQLNFVNGLQSNSDRPCACSGRNILDIPYPRLANGGIGNVSGRSGRYVLLKLLRADGRVGAENIDLQWVGFSGFIGAQPFSYGAMN